MDSIFSAEGRSIGEFLRERWTDMGDGLGLPHSMTGPVTEQVVDLLRPWADIPVGRTCPFPSFVAGDGFPAEMSVKWSQGRPELRILFEALGASRPVTAASNLAAAAELTDRLAAEPLVSLDWYRKVADVFAPAADQGTAPTPVWHSLAWRPGRPPAFKLYFGLYDLAPQKRYAAVNEAMERLGMGTAWADTCVEVARATMADGVERELEFFALDLDSSAKARAKVYFRNHTGSVAVLEQMASLARAHEPDRARSAFRTLLGTAPDAAGDTPLTCLAFRSGANRADESTTYFRVSSLTASDAEAAVRIGALMAHEDLDPRRHHALLQAVAPQPLNRIRGLQELVSYRSRGSEGDVSVYFRFPLYPPLAAQPSPVPRQSRVFLQEVESV
ncbi:tryptophan dimethylallyltransferase family protein [Streptacidiphilus anmyonensis]|uniref:tryptophan dimethylallyltransferase family protein n=1 Tax=Streptacidiphilus anmyonensis TaxID=405782 RepID=UPI000694EEA4|nr:tryptophan dimethylallyltransferase family protein [Streptacidiphilus anmyonensis]